MLFKSTNSHCKNLTINKISTHINIDGNGNENTWNQISWEQIDQINPHFSNVTNFSAQFKMCYDDNNIYILVKVNDPTPMQEGHSTWQNDCVQIYFAMDTSNSTSYRNGDWLLRKAAAKNIYDNGMDGQMGIYYGMSFIIGSLLYDPNFKLEQFDGASYYIQEWQIPITNLINCANFNGSSFRFDIEAVDDDGSQDKTGSLFWSSNADDQWNKILHQGYIYLSEPIPNYNNNSCQQYSDWLRMSRDSIKILTLQLNQAINEKTRLTDTINQLQLKLIQSQAEQKIIADSLSVLYKMLINNQSISILSFNEVTTSVTMKNGNIDLHIYPNPAHDKMLIECSENISSYGIYTTSGKLISSSTLPATEQSPYTIKLPTLSSGLYYLHLQTNKGIIAVLFLKN